MLPSRRRLTLPTTGLLVAVLALGAMAAPTYADETAQPPVADPTVSSADAAAATDALEQVQSILEDPSAASTGGEDLTLALRDLRLHQDDLTSRQRATAQRLAPTRPASDAYRDFGNVRIHWESDDDSITDQWVNQVGAVVTHVLATYRAAGYRAPESDGTRGGGSGLLDIYLVDFTTPGLYGYCDAAVVPPASGPYDTSAYCAFNHDFQEFPNLTPLKNLKVTAAHELFHATQFAYDYTEDAWFLEATAAWAEDEVYTDINDNRQYLGRSPMRQPRQSLDEFAGDLRHYGRWIFFRYLSERFPQAQGGMPVIVRQLMKRIDASRGGPDNYSIQAVSRELAARGTDLRRVYAQFGDANRHPATAYDEGRFYRAAPASRTWTLTGQRHDSRWQRVRLDHLATTTVQVKPGAAFKGQSLRIAVDLPRTRTGVAAVVTRYDKQGKPRTKLVRLTKAGNGRAVVPFDARTTTRIDVTLSNAGTRYRCWQGSVNSHGTPVTYSCSGRPQDDGVAMSYRVSIVR